MITRRVQCDCGHRFAFSRKEFIESLPYEIQQQFPFFLSYKTGIDKTLLQMLVASCDNGLNFVGIRNLVRENYTSQYMQSQSIYYSTIISHIQSQPGTLAAKLENEAQVPPFSDFADKLGYNGQVPSRKFVSIVVFSEPSLTVYFVGLFRVVFVNATGSEGG